ncbi:uncharacterized protein LOC108105201 isoform X2 [Drosophila eugracilis]|uniref:uncharacterized protein LOC108105201 isoform X2 n=1 Tax=Drosophila eugracilis TaxID=29029 RepID=UPI001BDB64DB|nr:uncharacterized protein LOC108105201 isoform X2 [Drosophila eugracilis]
MQKLNASPIYTPIFLTAAILLYRSNEILKEECDMASVHCLLSTLPENLPFEELLRTSTMLVNKYNLSEIENDVEVLICQEKKLRVAEENMVINRRRQMSRPAKANQIFSIGHWLSKSSTSKSLILTSALSIAVGICVYYYKNQYLAAGIS